MEESREMATMAMSRKVVSCAVMNPVLWGSLPRELLVLVLARLPVPEITRLRCQLSKEWTMNMKFNQSCDEANPNMAALLSNAREPNEFSVRIFDFSKYIWLYEYRFRLTNRGNPPSRFDSVRTESFWMPLASDGGLVCFVSTWLCTKTNPLCIVVINPLTRVQHELPPMQHVCFFPPTLVHMKVDSDTKGYKVVAVGLILRTGRWYTETYDSISREWSRAVPSWGHILGFTREWRIRDGYCFDLFDSWSCAFDLEEGQLESLDCDFFECEGAVVMRYRLAGDRMFVLHKKLNQYDTGSEFYFITEFQSQNSGKVWVSVGTHGQCFPEEGDDLVDLHACEDVLMFRNRIHSANQICSILNFSTSEWHNLPENSLEEGDISLMCRVSWNAIP